MGVLKVLIGKVTNYINELNTFYGFKHNLSVRMILDINNIFY